MTPTESRAARNAAILGGRLWRRDISGRAGTAGPNEGSNAMIEITDKQIAEERRVAAEQDVWRLEERLREEVVNSARVILEIQKQLTEAITYLGSLPKSKEIG